MRAVVAFVPDLMDRSRITGVAGANVRFASTPADLVVVDLSRPGVVDVLPDVSAQGVRTLGFGSHVDTATFDAARAAGCDQVMARSAFFSQLRDLLG